jgi:hypothetical protein
VVLFECFFRSGKVEGKVLVRNLKNLDIKGDIVENPFFGGAASF